MKTYRILRNEVELVKYTYAYTVQAETPEAAKEALNNDDFLEVEVEDEDIIEIVYIAPENELDITDITDNIC